MSILIKGAKMPKDCFECPLYNLDHVCVILNRQNLAFDKPIDCPLVEIPPHGRLIDADKVTRKMERLATEAWQKELSDTVEHTLNMSMDIIKHAPTVIKSEEQEHE